MSNFRFVFLSNSFYKKVRNQFSCIYIYQFRQSRSSQRRCSVRKVVLRNFAKFTGEHLRQSLLFNKVAGLIKKETPAQVFSCEFCEISTNTFFIEHPWAIITRWLGDYFWHSFLNISTIASNINYDSKYFLNFSRNKALHET